MTLIHDELVIFHRIPKAKVVLSQNGVLSEHEVYTLATDEARKHWGVYARKGSGYIRLHANKMTGKTGVRVHSYHLPFKVEGSAIGYLTIPPGWKWP